MATKKKKPELSPVEKEVQRLQRRRVSISKQLGDLRESYEKNAQPLENRLTVIDALIKKLSS